MVWAHEGHAPLPSTGASVHGDQLLLSQAAIQAIGLKLHTVSIGSIRHELQVNAHVELPPLRRAKVATMLSGRVRAVHARPGDRVSRRTVLASVESLELESLQVDLLSRATELALLEKLAVQQKRLADSGGIAGSVYLETQSQLRKKRAEHEIIQRKLAGWGMDANEIAHVLQTGKTMQAITITSPMAGVVEHVAIEPGQLVQSTDHLFDVVDPSTVYLVGEVLEADAHLIRDGAPVAVIFAGLPGLPYTGRIGYQHLHLHLPQRTLHVVVPVSNADGRLRPGMFGRMTITIAAAKDEIVCPVSALIETQTGHFVLRRTDEGKFKLQRVQIGMRSRTQVVITSGLFPGQQVISRGTYLLSALFDGHAQRSRNSEVGIQKSQAGTGNSKLGSPQSTIRNPYSAEGSRSEQLAAARAVVEIPVGKRAFATSLIEGWIVQIADDPQHPLHEGVRVVQGQLLARIRSRQLRNMQLELLQAAARVKWTQEEVRRLKPVAGTGAVAAKELWQREAELKVLQMQIASLKRRLKLIGLTEAHLKSLLEFDLAGPRKPGQSSEMDPIIDAIEIRSPMTGRISRFFVSPGELVHEHDKLFEIQDTGEVWIKAYYFEREAARIGVGCDALATFPSHPSLRLRGKVVRIAPQLASKDRVLSVWIEVPNPGHFLKEGMLADVVVQASR